MNGNHASMVGHSIEQSIAVKQALLADKELIQLITTVGGAFVKALGGGRKILLFGNGGSAADAQHIAAEFVGRFHKERPPLPALALTVDTSALTCIGNDYGYENVFARQLVALGAEGDIAVGISTSGNSPNVVKGLAAARDNGLVTVALTGKNRGGMGEHAEYCICVPSDVTARIQEAHILIGHILCEITDAELAPV